MRSRYILSLIALTVGFITLIAVVAVFFVAMLWPVNQSNWRSVIPLSGLRDGEPVQPDFINDVTPVYIVKIDDELQAFSRYAPFVSRCLLIWNKDRKIFADTCGGVQFDIHGEYVAGPAQRTLDRHPVRVIDGWVQVDTSKTIRGRNFWND